jgi:hypothetical protein
MAPGGCVESAKVGAGAVEMQLDAPRRAKKMGAKRVFFMTNGY